jgi:hypothetical protein
VITDITDLVLETETLEEERKSKPNGTKFQINPVKNDNEEVNAIKYGNNRGEYN